MEHRLWFPILILVQYFQPMSSSLEAQESFLKRWPCSFKRQGELGVHLVLSQMSSSLGYDFTDASRMKSVAFGTGLLGPVDNPGGPLATGQIIS